MCVTQVGEYLALLQQLAGMQAELRAAINAPQHALPFLQPGRLVRPLACCMRNDGWAHWETKLDCMDPPCVQQHPHATSPVSPALQPA